ncbi:MAG: M10 family metallopeptidase C-terminal domain-containing protein [Geminicoccaceae bacterium]
MTSTIRVVGTEGKLVNPLIGAYKWAGTASGTTIDYSFAGIGSPFEASYGNNEPSKISSLTDTQKAYVRAALKSWEAVANIHFNEVTETASNVGTLRFAFTDVSHPADTEIVKAAGWAYEPTTNPARIAEAGDVWFSGVYKSASFAPGTFEYYTVLHEIGHAIGLKHPHEGGDILAATDDWPGNTVMTYRSFPNDDPDGVALSYFPTTPMLLDIAATQRNYGKSQISLGNTTYKWSENVKNIFETIFDYGGNDTVSWEGHTTSARIDLKPGSWSQIGPDILPGESPGTKLPGNLAITTLSLIENAIGGAGNDKIYGNDAYNKIDGGGGNDVIYGDARGDVLTGGTGADIFLGTLGTTTAPGSLNGDEITDFEVSDRIRVENSSFTTRDVSFRAGYLWLPSGTTIKLGTLFDNKFTAAPGPSGSTDVVYSGLDPRGDFVFSLAEFGAHSKIEGSTSAASEYLEYLIVREGNINKTASVKYAVEKGPLPTASGDDFTAGKYPTGVVVFNPGVASIAVQVLLHGDTVAESDENLTFRLLSADGGRIDQARAVQSGLIINDDGGPKRTELSIATLDADHNEGSSLGSTAFTFTVNRIGVISGPGAVAYAVAGSGASPVNAVDFVGGAFPSGIINFAANESTKTIAINVAADTLIEPDESFKVTLSNPTGGAVLTTVVAVGTIRNDDSDTQPVTGDNSPNNLKGGPGDDTIFGLGGDDTLQGGLGNDHLDGGSGIDTASYVDAAGPVQANLKNGTSQGALGNDHLVSIENITGGNFADSLGGDSLSNNILGGAGNDKLYGDAGDDTLLGQAGDDTLYGFTGADRLDGGDGVDTASYADATGAVQANLIKGTSNGALGQDKIVGIENLTGGNYNDTLGGDTGANMLQGGAGNDKLYGDAGNDTLQGQDGDDTLFGFTGDDKLDGGVGTDTASYADISVAGVTVNLALTTAQATGGAGKDTLASIENVIGTALADSLIGSSDANTLTGGFGKDTLKGNAGNDLFDFNTAADSAVGANADWITDFTGVGANTGDRIDLADVYAGMLSFKGTGAFSGVGQVRVLASGSDTIVQVNLSGTTAPEMEIHVQDGAATPGQWVAGDFIL